VATGQSILDRMKRSEWSGALPMIAFYGQEPDRELERNVMYQHIEHVFGDRVIPARRPLKYMDFVVDSHSSPLEYLVWRGELETGEDEIGMAGVRFHTALRLRDLCEGSQVNGMKSPSYEGMPGGGGGVNDITAYQLDCARMLASARSAMSKPWIFPLLEMVIVQDQWFDLGEQKAAMARRRREQTVVAIRYGLDLAAAAFGSLFPQAVTRRWKEAPVMPVCLLGHHHGRMADLSRR